jgi:non-canonical (house-cleaning) NTP pyrophosphatase
VWGFRLCACTCVCSQCFSVYIFYENQLIGVSNQPLGDTETRRGAMNRAKAAYEAACSSLNNDSSMGNKPDFSVGLEGGLDGAMEIPPDDLWCMAWMAIYGSQSEVCIAAKAEDDTFTSSSNVDQMQWGFAKTAAFLLPPALCELLLNNDDMELGDADDIVFKRVNSKHGQGTVGKLTNGQIDRTEYYVHALKLALIPWIRPELYMTREDKQQSTVIVV